MRLTECNPGDNNNNNNNNNNTLFLKNARHESLNAFYNTGLNINLKIYEYGNQKAN